MKITDLNGQIIEIENLQLAILQADDYRHYGHSNPAQKIAVAQQRLYWEDMYQKLTQFQEDTTMDMPAKQPSFERTVGCNWLAILNKRVVFINFALVDAVELTYQTVVADYFGYTLTVAAFKLDIYPSDNPLFSVDILYTDNETTRQVSNLATTNSKLTLKEVLNVINTSIRSRPFTIIQRNDELYQLLDPNGFDYIGQYITLNEAKRISAYNFKLQLEA